MPLTARHSRFQNLSVGVESGQRREADGPRKESGGEVQAAGCVTAHGRDRSASAFLVMAEAVPASHLAVTELGISQVRAYTVGACTVTCST